MKKLLVLLLISSIAFVSCDGRARKYEKNRAVLERSNLYQSFSKKIHFIPESPLEIVTDTILSTGFEVKLKYTSIEDSFVSKIEKLDKEITEETNYKNFEAELMVLKHGKLISHGLINKALFKKHQTSPFFEKAIMQHVWVDYAHSNENEIQLNTSFRVIETNSFKDFSILINSLGLIEIKEINLLSNTI
jgi:hypothetical protein